MLFQELANIFYKESDRKFFRPRGPDGLLQLFNSVAAGKQLQTIHKQLSLTVLQPNFLYGHRNLNCI